MHVIQDASTRAKIAIDAWLELTRDLRIVRKIQEMNEIHDFNANLVRIAFTPFASSMGTSA